MTAIDGDQGKNGEVMYGLVGESSEHFEIDSVTGDLFVIGYAFTLLSHLLLIDRSSSVDWISNGETSTR